MATVRLTADDGSVWDTVWGVSEMWEDLASHLGVPCPVFVNNRDSWETVTFVEPRYGETKTLFVNRDDSGQDWAMAEITPGVYAQARRADA